MPLDYKYAGEEKPRGRWRNRFLFLFTAGEGAGGYNATIIGFAPSKKTKIAFAIVAEHSGKAEFEAARITKLFLESIQGYI